MAVLSGIRILDFSRYIAAPLACGLLADMGAEVIRVEPPGGDEDRTVGPVAPDGRPVWFNTWAHGRQGITLDLRQDAGRALLRRLVRCADVVVHNFTPGSRQASWLGYDALRSENPSVIVAAVSAYGQTGPWAARGGFDSLIQGVCGVMSLTGFPGGPPVRPGAPWVDVSYGYNTALGIMFALFERARSGLGQLVDVGLLDNAVFPLIVQGMISEMRLTGAARTAIGNESWYTYLNTFQARDGWVTISPSVDSLWRRLAEAIERPELAEDPRFRGHLDRFAHREILNEILGAWVRDRTVADVTERLNAARVPCGPVATLAEMAENPQVAAREMLIEIASDHAPTATVPGYPIKFSRTPAHVGGAAPAIGEHNFGVYGELLGLSNADLAGLHSTGVI